jgi:DNA end-binding protein Ku
MAARAIGSGTVSFGLVSIPVKVYSTTESATQLSFNMLHAACGTRLKQQYVCPKCDVVVGRNETARGYEFAKGQYVMLSDAEYKALQEVASNRIELTEFVPGAAVDPVYFDRAYYLGPDKGGERAYKLLAEAMEKTGYFGVARYAARGKQYLVLVRPREGRLVMHQLHYPDEIKSFDEVPIADTPDAKAAELKLAVQFIEQLARETFAPKEYEDEVKTRMLELIEQKIQGQEITSAPEVAPQAKVIDLMEALKASLGEARSASGPARKPARAKASKGKSSEATRKRKTRN